RGWGGSSRAVRSVHCSLTRRLTSHRTRRVCCLGTVDEDDRPDLTPRYGPRAGLGSSSAASGHAEFRRVPGRLARRDRWHRGETIGGTACPPGIGGTPPSPRTDRSTPTSWRPARAPWHWS